MIFKTLEEIGKFFNEMDYASDYWKDFMADIFWNFMSHGLAF